MITNIDDINTALEAIETEDAIYPAVMSDKMDATAFNAACNRIEEQLNELYEKIRYVEEIDEFCRDYVLQEIETKENKLRESLKIAEDVSDLYKNKSSVSILVPFKACDTKIYDRDGSIISKMNVKNKKLEADNDIMADATFANVIFSSNSTCYNNNYNNLLKGKAASSFYTIKEPVEGGVRETVTMSLVTPAQCNYLSIHPVNCEIENARILDENQKEHPVPSNGYFKKQAVSGIIFDVIAKQYVMEGKTGDQNAYDYSGAFGMTDTAYTRWQDEQIIKQMEISQAEADKKYIVSALETRCDSWGKLNADARHRNIVLAGEK